MLGIATLEPPALLALLIETVRTCTGDTAGPQALMAALRQDVRGKQNLEALQQRASADADVYGCSFLRSRPSRCAPFVACACARAFSQLTCRLCYCDPKRRRYGALYRGLTYAGEANSAADAALAASLGLDAADAHSLRALLLETVRACTRYFLRTTRTAAHDRLSPRRACMRSSC